MSKFAKYGAPFLCLLVGGSFALKHFASMRYENSKINMISRADVEKLGVKMKDKESSSINSQLEELQNTDLDNWKNIRGPRPWEDSKTIQDQQR